MSDGKDEESDGDGKDDWKDDGSDERRREFAKFAEEHECLYSGYAGDHLNGWLNDACVGGGKTLYPGLKESKRACDLKLIRSLVAKGACLKRSNALHAAVANNHPDCVRLLLELGAKVDEVDEQDNTALHIAAIVKAVESIRVLLEFGASRDAKNNIHQTPHQAALAEKAMSDRWCAKLDIVLDSEEDILDRKNYPVVLKLLESRRRRPVGPVAWEPDEKDDR